MLLSSRRVRAGIGYWLHTCSARPSILAREHLLASTLANCANSGCAVSVDFELRERLALVNTVSLFNELSWRPRTGYITETIAK